MTDILMYNSYIKHGGKRVQYKTKPKRSEGVSLKCFSSYTDCICTIGLLLNIDMNWSTSLDQSIFRNELSVGCIIYTSQEWRTLSNTFLQSREAVNRFRISTWICLSIRYRLVAVYRRVKLLLASGALNVARQAFSFCHQIFVLVGLNIHLGALVGQNSCGSWTCLKSFQTCVSTFWKDVLFSWILLVFLFPMLFILFSSQRCQGGFMFDACYFDPLQRKTGDCDIGISLHNKCI